MTLLPVHVMGGLVGIVAGFVALAAIKGGRRHRRSGMVFVYAMLTMSATGAAIALLKSNGWGTAMGGFLAFYLVTTGLVASRRGVPGFQWTDLAALLMAVTLGVTYYTFGFQAVSSPSGKAYGYPSPLYFVFGTVTWLAAFGDARVLVRGIQGSRRLARHVWRMCFAMFIATASFFLGQAKVIPEPLRIMPLLWIPVLLVLGMMLYWLVRLRLKKAPSVVTSESLEPVPLRGAA
jgi:uncharacterized membrane protein